MPIIRTPFGEIEREIMEEIKRKIRFIILTFFILSIHVKLCYGHPMPNSVVVLLKERGYVLAEARIPLPDLQLMLKDSVIRSEKAMKTYLAQHIHPKNLNGALWKIEIGKIEFISSKDEMVGNYTELVFDFKMYPPNDEISEIFNFDYDIVCHQVITHKVDIYLAESSVKEDFNKMKLVGQVRLDTQSGGIIFPIIALGKSNLIDKILPSNRVLILIGLVFFAIILYSSFKVK